MRTGGLEDQRTFEIETISSEGKNLRPGRPGHQNLFSIGNQMTIGLKVTKEDCEFGGKEDRRNKEPKDKRTITPEDQATDLMKLRGPEKPGIKRTKEHDRRPDDQKIQRIEDKMGGGQQNCFLVAHVESYRDSPEG